MFQADLEHECTRCPLRAMTALTPSHKRIRVLDTRLKEGDISDEYEDLDTDLERKQELVKDERAMNALTPSHKRIRVVDSKDKEGEISDEYEDADIAIKHELVKDEKLSRKRKRDLTNSLQSKSVRIEAEPLDDEELLIQEDLTEEEIGLKRKMLSRSSRRRRALQLKR